MAFSIDEVVDLYKHVINKSKHWELIGLMTILVSITIDRSRGLNPNFLAFIQIITLNAYKNILIYIF